MSEAQLTTAAVEEALRDFQDPETGRSIVRQEQVHDIQIDGDRLSLTLGLTSFCAGLWEDIRAELADHLSARLPQLAEATINVAEHHRPAEKQGEVGLAAKCVVAVGSGKGGVGKSTVAATLAFGLSRAGSRVGLLDADVYGPSIPHLLGTKDRPKMVDEQIQPVRVDGIAVMSMGFMLSPDEAVMWRGPMLHGAITQFLRDTAWGELDYLIIDMPPGTGDVALTLSQLLPLAGAVVVCTPQDVALLDAAKAITMFRTLKIEVLGMVENMSTFVCPDCGSRHDIFSSGGARRKAEESGVPFLGDVPLNIQIRTRGDEGTLASALDDPALAPSLTNLSANLVRNLIAKRRAKPPMPTLSVLG
ncbi:MAG: Mrp/NBP35 family ATP-binding protein [Planctomycetes bacterium]|nr:Mrp/NBP35 family ATP-binding protein [Planctomycetota bacterium]